MVCFIILSCVGSTFHAQSILPRPISNFIYINYSTVLCKFNNFFMRTATQLCNVSSPQPSQTCAAFKLIPTTYYGMLKLLMNDSLEYPSKNQRKLVCYPSIPCIPCFPKSKRKMYIKITKHTQQITIILCFECHKYHIFMTHQQPKRMAHALKYEP